jgi:hypothetical protein
MGVSGRRSGAPKDGRADNIGPYPMKSVDAHTDCTFGVPDAGCPSAERYPDLEQNETPNTGFPRDRTAKGSYAEVSSSF